jgi:hypothetical protein
VNVYKLNLTIGSFVLGFGATYVLHVTNYFLDVAFVLTLVFGIALHLVAVPLVPPRLEVGDGPLNLR